MRRECKLSHHSADYRGIWALNRVYSKLGGRESGVHFGGEWCVWKQQQPPGSNFRESVVRKSEVKVSEMTELVI